MLSCSHVRLGSPIANAWGQECIMMSFCGAGRRGGRVALYPGMGRSLGTRLKEEHVAANGSMVLLKQ